MTPRKLYQTLLENPRIAHMHLQKRRRASWQIISTSLLIAAVITSSMLFYVWARVNVVELNYAIVDSIEMERQLLEKNRQFHLQLAALTSPTRLDVIATNRFNMQWPKSDQIVYMK